MATEEPNNRKQSGPEPCCEQERPKPLGDEARQSAEQPPEKHRRDPYPKDEVEEASIESFPASDPPGYGNCHV